MKIIAIKKGSHSQNNAKPNCNSKSTKDILVNSDEFGSLLRKNILEEMRRQQAAEHIQQKMEYFQRQKEQDEITQKNETIEFMLNHVGQAFRLQAKEVINSNFEKFEYLDVPTTYITLLNILTDFNNRKI